MSNRYDIQFLRNPHNKATLIDCNFVVDSTNGNGLGIRSLKNGGRIKSIYMNTSATPAPGNPNPAAGYIQAILQDNYNNYYGGFSGQVVPVSGTPLTSTTAGLMYVIVSLGTTTAAQWLAAGLPASIKPAVGVSFVALATGAIGGTGAVEVPATGGSGIDHIVVVGDSNLMNAQAGQLGGMYVNMVCLKNGVVTAPANGSAIVLAFYLNSSAQGV